MGVEGEAMTDEASWALLAGSKEEINVELGPCIILELMVVDRGDKVRESRRRRRVMLATVGGFGVEMDKAENGGPAFEG